MHKKKENEPIKFPKEFLFTEQEKLLISEKADLYQIAYEEVCNKYPRKDHDS
jgi:hypothetical protein